jgi:hypothetical protein
VPEPNVMRSLILATIEWGNEEGEIKFFSRFGFFQDPNSFIFKIK